ncbi:MAG: DUF559 domain-containing protein [Polyangiaceae bacterium]
MSARLALKQYARNMRHAPTTGEALLWQVLSASKLGVRFNRQHVIGRYIADFCAPSARLVIEVDGASHANRARADGRRDRYLARLGFRTLRLSDQLVRDDLQAALAAIRHALAATA